jgi:hypothetical protein
MLHTTPSILRSGKGGNYKWALRDAEKNEGK